MGGGGGAEVDEGVWTSSDFSLDLSENVGWRGVFDRESLSGAVSPTIL
jgi:hypothetical protein